MVAVLGNSLGILCHVAVATLGLSAVLRTSPAAYTVLRFSGAVYLMYLGIRIARQGPLRPTGDGKGTRSSFSKIFRNGMLVNILNPKVAILMLALLPEFVNPSNGNLTAQTAAIGSVHMVVAGLVLTCLVLLAGRSSVLLGQSAWSGKMFCLVSGCILIGLGIRVAIAASP